MSGGRGDVSGDDPSLYVGLLGDVEVLVDARPVPVEGVRRQGLVARLAIAGADGVRTEQLVDDLAIPGGGDRGLATLRTYVSKLRRLLGPAADRLSGGGGRLRLVLAADELDVTLFERRALDGDLGAALSLWRSAPLVPFADHEWAQIEAQRLAQRRLDVFARWNEQRLAAGDAAAALADLETLIAEEPFHEGFRVQYVRALYACGRPADALGAQRAAVRALTEVGLEPGPDLARLAHDILTHSPDLTGRDEATVTRVHGVVPTPLRPRRGEPTFVGRGRELAAVADALAEVERTGPAVVVVRGEPGVGKTRLAAESSRAAAARGSAVLYGRCEDAVDLPFGPLIEMFGAVTDLPGDGGRPVGPRRSDIDDALARRRLLERFASACRDLCASAPLLVVVDDVQWANASTMAAFRSVLELVDDAPVLLVLTLRTVDPAPDGTPGVEAFHRGSWPLEIIDLDGLGLGEVGWLLGAEHDGAMSAEEVLEATGGNPYLVTELARSGRREVPASVLDVLSSRLERVSPLARDLAGTAALSGLEFSLAEIGAAIGEEPEALVGAAEELVAVGLLDEADATGRLQFRHALARAAVDSRTTTIRRAHRHRRLAEVLEGSAEPPAERIAHHWEHAGREHGGRAARWFALAGSAALESYAWEAAVDHLERAIALADDPAAPWLTRASLDLAAAHTWLGDAAAARTAIWAAAARANGADDVEAFAAAALWGTTGGRGASLWRADGERLDLLEHAWEWLEDVDGPTILRVRVAGELALARFRLHERDRRQSVADAALRLADADGSTPVLAAALAASRVRLWHPSDRDRRRRYVRAALEHAVAADDPWLLADALDAERTDAHEVGDRERFDAAGRRLLELAARHGGAHLRWRAAVVVGHEALLDGRVADVPVLAEAGLAVWGADPAPDAVLGYGSQMAVAALLDDRVADALGLIEMVGDDEELLVADAAVALGLAGVGRRDEASARVVSILADGARRLPHDSGYLTALAALADAVGYLGDPESAAALLPLVEPWAASIPVMVGPGISWPPLAHAVGLLKQVVGDHATAEVWFDEAERRALEFGATGLARRTATMRSDTVAPGRVRPGP